MRSGRHLPAELRHPLFVAGVVTYLLLILYKTGSPLVAGWPQPPVLLRAHLADALALPLLLTLELWGLRRFYFRQPAFVLPRSWIFSSWLAFSLWFEWLLPRFDARATADWRDVLAYALGGLVFARWMNRPASRAIQPEGPL
ncbi:hypothetical protein D0N36_02340 [Hymenobacter lapidiphilus]|uniref:hypothetical protein n=1 Tax=Hymenobacter sp. CCM 8763 TaxID=2303334 RepID=UPI000E353CBF|nr:hypothetical protein [Hymenobacter sp. CCM 8763]RFP66569.1 hypothetical protein D0N36_02340 [Hymenobacter sp. CCM 8763]